MDNEKAGLGRRHAGTLGAVAARCAGEPTRSPARADPARAAARIDGDSVRAILAAPACATLLRPRSETSPGRSCSNLCPRLEDASS